MRLQSIILLLLHLAGLIGLIAFASACVSAAVATATSRPTIRYGANGVPILVKGANLSAPLDNDPVFQNLKDKDQYADIAFYYLDSQKALFKVTSARDAFIVHSVDTDALGQKHVKLDQVYNDIPVWARQVSIHLNGDNQVYLFQGNYRPVGPGLATTAVITRQSAGELAIQTRPDPDRWRVHHSAICIWFPDDRLQRLAYKVTLLKNTVYRQRCFVDAIDGSILYCLSATPDRGSETTSSNTLMRKGN